MTMSSCAATHAMAMRRMHARPSDSRPLAISDGLMPTSLSLMISTVVFRLPKRRRPQLAVSPFGAEVIAFATANAC